MIADEIRDLHLPGADGGQMVCVDLNAVLRVPHVQQQNVKVEDGVRRDDVTCRTNHKRSQQQNNQLSDIMRNPVYKTDQAGEINA